VDGESWHAKQRLVLARAGAGAARIAARQQFISPAQVQAKAARSCWVCRPQAQALERQRAAALQRERRAEGERRSLPLLARGAQGALERDLAELAREAAEQGRGAPRRARAAGRHGERRAGRTRPERVARRSALASLVPQGAKLQAQLYAPSSAVGFVRPGQPVRLRYEAFPYQKYGQQGGPVLQVSRTPLAGQ
jgi:membrane fusion protein